MENGPSTGVAADVRSRTKNRIRFMDEITADTLRGFNKYMEAKGLSGKTRHNRLMTVFFLLKKNDIKNQLPWDEMPCIARIHLGTTTVGVVENMKDVADLVKKFNDIDVNRRIQAALREYRISARSKREVSRLRRCCTRIEASECRRVGDS